MVKEVPIEKVYYPAVPNHDPTKVFEGAKINIEGPDKGDSSDDEKDTYASRFTAEVKDHITRKLNRRNENSFKSAINKLNHRRKNLCSFQYKRMDGYTGQRKCCKKDRWLNTIFCKVHYYDDNSKKRKLLKQINNKSNNNNVETEEEW